MDLPEPVLRSYQKHFREIRGTVGYRLHEVLDHFGTFDEELEQLCARIVDWRQRYCDSLLLPDRFLAAFWSVRTDAQNGGFHQFFLNSDGDSWPDLLRLLELGQNEAALSHFRRVLAVFPDSKPEFARELREEQLALLDRSRSGNFLDPFAALNAEYYTDCFYPDENTLFVALRSLENIDFIPDPDFEP